MTLSLDERRGTATWRVAAGPGNWTVRKRGCPHVATPPSRRRGGPTPAEQGQRDRATAACKCLVRQVSSRWPLAPYSAGVFVTPVRAGSTPVPRTHSTHNIVRPQDSPLLATGWPQAPPQYGGPKRVRGLSRAPHLLPQGHARRSPKDTASTARRSPKGTASNAHAPTHSAQRHRISAALRPTSLTRPTLERPPWPCALGLSAV